MPEKARGIKVRSAMLETSSNRRLSSTRDFKVAILTLMLVSLSIASVEAYRATLNVGWADSSFTEGWLPTTVFGVHSLSVSSDGNVYTVSIVPEGPEAYLTLTKDINIDAAKYRSCIVRWKVYPKGTHVSVWVQRTDSLGESATSAVFDDTVGDWSRLYHNVEGGGATDWVETVARTPQGGLITEVSIRVGAYPRTGESTVFQAFFQFIKFVMDVPVLLDLSFLDLVTIVTLGILFFNVSACLLRKFPVRFLEGPS